MENSFAFPVSLLAIGEKQLGKSAVGCRGVAGGRRSERTEWTVVACSHHGINPRPKHQTLLCPQMWQKSYVCSVALSPSHFHPFPFSHGNYVSSTLKSPKNTSGHDIHSDTHSLKTFTLSDKPSGLLRLTPKTQPPAMWTQPFPASWEVSFSFLLSLFFSFWLSLSSLFCCSLYKL